MAAYRAYLARAALVQDTEFVDVRRDVPGIDPETAIVPVGSGDGGSSSSSHISSAVRGMGKLARLRVWTDGPRGPRNS